MYYNNFSFNIIFLEVRSWCLTILLRIRKTSVSNLGLEMGYTGEVFPQPKSEIVPKIRLRSLSLKLFPILCTNYHTIRLI
jgi:hypothetical protein